MFVFVSKILLRKGFGGIALWPFIILRKKSYRQDQVFMNHEKIHLAQQIELLVIPFYIWYGLEYLIKLIKYKDRKQAYCNLCFEREAYENESNLTYLTQRKRWSFLKHL